MSNPSSTLVVVATYNEMENLPRLTDEIFGVAPDVRMLVIDDASPDGTGRWCDERKALDPRFFVVHRSGKLGLGSATIAGFRWALERDFEFVVVMDADFSHHPSYLPDLLAGTSAGDDIDPVVDVMIGSRYVEGGGVEGWPWRRRWMSRCVNVYARCLLGLTPRDCSGAYRCYRAARLKDVDLDSIQSRGFAFQEEILWRLKRAGAQFGETPITFVDRQFGESKINMREAWAALWVIFRLGLTNWLGHRPPTSSSGDSAQPRKPT